MIDNATEWYWQCGELKTLDKYEAMEKNFHNPSLPIDFKIPQCYYQHDFSVEPYGNWNELLAQRATSIREKSKYIKLWFSGGCDSIKMLSTFLENNIFVDEIFLLKSGIPAADTEIDNGAIPWLLSNKNKIHPNTKINIRNESLSKYQKNIRENKKFQVVTPNPQYTRLNNFNERQIIETENQFTHLFGREKPTLMYQDGEWFFYFLDVNIEPMQKATNLCFFYSGDPIIHSKQCHMLKNYIQENFNLDSVDSLTQFNTIVEQKHKNYGSGRIDGIEEKFIYKDLGFEHATHNYKSYSKKEALAKDYFAMYCPSVIKSFNHEMDKLSKFCNGKWFNQGRPEYGTVGVFSDFISLTQKNTYKNNTGFKI